MMRMYALDFPEGKGLLHEEMLVPFDYASSAKAYLTMRPLVLSKNSPEWVNSPIATIREKEGPDEFVFSAVDQPRARDWKLEFGKVA